jgi:hypothetical protein
MKKTMMKKKMVMNKKKKKKKKNDDEEEKEEEEEEDYDEMCGVRGMWRACEKRNACTRGAQSFYEKVPQPLFLAGTLDVSGKISGIPNGLNCCVIFV